MCSIEEEIPGLKDPEVAPEPKSRSNPNRKACLKCRSPADIVLRDRDTYCKNCFEPYFIHKFRSQLGKTRLIYPNEKVLVAFSGGPASRAMVEMIREGTTSGGRHEKMLRFKPEIIHVDEGCLFGGGSGVVGSDSVDGFNADVNKDEAKAICEASGIPFEILPLWKIFSEEYSESGKFGGILESNEFNFDLNGATSKKSMAECVGREEMVSIGEKGGDEKDLLFRLFRSLCTITAREDMLKMLKNRLIQMYAAQNGFTKVLYGESTTRLSINSLANVSKGRGFTLPLDVGFADAESVPGLTLMRPMRDYLSKEISYFLRIRRLTYVTVPSFSTKQTNMKTSSVDHLTEKFLTELQKDYPSTINTICRTVDKLIFKDRESEGLKEFCTLCHSPLSSTEQAQAISVKRSMTSHNKSSQCCGEESTCSGGEPCSGGGKEHYYNSLSVGDFMSTLCYGCALVVGKEIKTRNVVLPPCVAEQTQRYVHRANAKEKIAEYLLSDSEEDSGGD